ELLFLNKLHPVYHGETGIRTLKELARSYLTITRDLTRVMNRLKAIYLRPAAKKAGAHIEDGQRFGLHNLRHSLSNWLVVTY
ncbi:MAG TPA: hypothetical protein VN037_15010, partial [Verrucomicrobiae bacterium]|nr:hypothetical protein [Verrucomicrobiae bacterium]